MPVMILTNGLRNGHRSDFKTHPCKGVVVLSAHASCTRAPADIFAGGDYDGDRVLVITDPEFVSCLQRDEEQDEPDASVLAKAKEDAGKATTRSAESFAPVTCLLWSVVVAGVEGAATHLSHVFCQQAGGCMS